jgi:metal-dependent amidase/aminoacylase/carboxypeptidase family protein
MLNLGVVPADRESTAVHSPTFLADEAAIPIGVNLMANILVDHLTAAGRAAGRR